MGDWLWVLLLGGFFALGGLLTTPFQSEDGPPEAPENGESRFPHRALIAYPATIVVSGLLLGVHGPWMWAFFVFGGMLLLLLVVEIFFIHFFLEITLWNYPIAAVVSGFLIPVAMKCLWLLLVLVWKAVFTK